jgi:hypothetical protein
MMPVSRPGRRIDHRDVARALVGDERVYAVHRQAVRCAPVPSSGDAALEHVANRPIAEHVLTEMESAGVRDVVIASTVVRAGEIRKPFASRELRTGLCLRYVDCRGPLDLARAIRLATPIVGESPCIVHLASGLLGEPLAPLVERLKNGSPDFVLNVHHQPGPDEHLSNAGLAAHCGTPSRAGRARNGWRVVFRSGCPAARKPDLVALRRWCRLDERSRADRSGRRHLTCATRGWLAQVRGKPARLAGAQPDCPRPA